MPLCIGIVLNKVEKFNLSYDFGYLHLSNLILYDQLKHQNRIYKWDHILLKSKARD